MEEKAIANKNQWSIHSALAEHAGQLEKALAGSIPREQFMRLCATVWQTGGPRMHKANFRSFMASCVQAAQLGLKPDSVLGECYLIPRKDKMKGPGTWVSFQLGYRGAMKLARRGGEVADIQPEVVYKNDEFRPMLGTSRGLHHIPFWGLGKKDGGDIVGAYCTAQLRDGTTSFRFVTREEIDKVCKSSGNPFDDSPSNVWRDHFEAMAMKTAVLRLCKFLPIPDDAKRAIIGEEYRDAGVPEATITVEAIDDMDLRIAEARQDPVNIEKVEFEKLTKRIQTRSLKFLAECGVGPDERKGAIRRAILFHGQLREVWGSGFIWPESKGKSTVEMMKAADVSLGKWNDLKGEDRNNIIENYKEAMPIKFANECDLPAGPGVE